ncbi:MAG: PKD domain-containing protein [Flavobacteriales bacterium]|nr:PKD domain-containing protein [Flavobacteriales bacterium]
MACTISGMVYGQCTTTIGAFPYTEGFEAAPAWTSGGVGNDWAWGTPAKPVINGAGGGNNCWVVGGLTGSNYSPGQQSWLESPCFDLTALPFPYISFKLFWECERTYDGLGFQYSLDQGATWSNVGSVTDQPDCYTQNWFNTPAINNLFQASPPEGWSGRIGPTVGNCEGGQGSAGWVTSSFCLAFLSGEASVKFRFIFGAGTTCNSYDGVAVDDIYIGEAPVEPIFFQYSCYADELEITGTSDCGTAWSWDFGDPASGAANTSQEQLPTHVFSAPGTYTVTLTQGYACRSPQVISTSITILDLEIITTQPTCAGNDGALEALVTGTSAPISYLWNPGGFTTSSITGLGPGNYAFVANAPGACPIGPGTLITLSPAAAAPEISSSVVEPSCSGAADGSITLTVTGGTPDLTYTWAPAVSTSGTANALAAGTYTCTVVDATACSTAVSVTLEGPEPVTITAQDDAAICAGDAITLTATASGGTAPYTFTWSPEGPAVTPAATTTYIVGATDANGCAGNAQEVVVSVGDVDPPVFSLDDPLGCTPHCVSFEVESGGGELLWDLGDGTQTNGPAELQHCYTAGGTYTVSLTATTPEGCSSTWTLVDAVDVLPSPIAAFIASPAVTTIEEPTITFIDQSTSADNISWLFGVGDAGSLEENPSFTYDSVGCYTVQLLATNLLGCSSTVTSEVCIEPAFALWVPNAFTPNGDAINDLFGAITTVSAPLAFELLIFNRWGQEVFRAESPDAAWDAAGVPDGIYAWRLRMRDTLGGVHERAGHVNVLR